MSSFGSLFKKVNGKKVLKEYAQSHVLFHALLLTVVEGTSKKSLEIVRESVSNKVVGRLRRQYKTFISDFKKNDSESTEGQITLCAAGKYWKTKADRKSGGSFHCGMECRSSIW